MYVFIVIMAAVTIKTRKFFEVDFYFIIIFFLNRDHEKKSEIRKENEYSTIIIKKIMVFRRWVI